MSDRADKSDRPKAKSEKKHHHKKTASAIEEVPAERSSTPPHEEPEPEAVPKLKSYPSSVPQLPEDEEVISVQQTKLREEDAFSKINPETLNSFGKVFEYAKNLGISFAKPEFVLIGKKGTGKTTLIESLLRQAKLSI